MKLLSCHIDNFGRLRNYDHVFAEGLNMILHENGWGKSTLAAFLCAMLYGMPGGKGRGGTGGSVQDRERYRPWQGGTYGGELIFEAEGRIFSMTRTFGSRESEDTFDLRDAETNLPEFRFTKSVGQDLLSLDRTSFLRTAMISQQDCSAGTTDNILALLTDLQDQSGDMDSYETALKRLSEASNRLTPRRRTGSLYHRAEKIRLLERDASGAEDLSSRILFCERERRQALELEEELSGQLEEYRKELDAVRLMIEDRSRLDMLDTAHRKKQEEIRRLRKEKQVRQDSAEKAAAFFPGRIPEGEEIEEQLQQCRVLTRLEYQMQSAMLTEDEQNRLTELEEYLRNSPAEKTASYQKKEGAARSTRVYKAGSATQWNIFFAAIGAALLVLGSLSIRIGTNMPSLIAGIAALAAGFTAAAVSCMRILREKGSKTGRRSKENRRSANARETSRDPGKEYGDFREEYTFLSRKEQRVEALHARWAEARKPVLVFLKELGFTPEEDLQEQLEELGIALKEYEAAQDRLRTADQALCRLEAEAADTSRAFEHRPFSVSPEEAASVLQPEPSLLRTLPTRIEDVQTSLLQCRRKITETDRELRELASEQEEMEAAAERLKDLQAEQERESAAYKRISAAASALRRAKESLTARYADPVRRSFSRYWEQITASSAANVFVDANASVTVEERGKQRDLSLFSAGYRDLAGVCLRIALVDAMYPEGRGVRPPLIMDDPFTSLDDEKMMGALRLLQSASERYQILYFTCSRGRCLPSQGGYRRT